MQPNDRYDWEMAGGQALEHWSFQSIEELLLNSKSISVGVMYPGKHIDGGIPLIRVADVKSGHVVEKPRFCISSEVHEEYKRTKLDGTELLITLVGNPGDCVIATQDMSGWNAARALAVLRLQDIGLRSWVRYVLLSPPAKHIIDSRLNTTVQRTLNLKDIKELKLPIAPRNERQSITAFLEGIEEKIELNRQMNTTLEAMAQALFKSWFVDFDPVIDNALAAGNPIPDALKDKAAARAALGDAGKPLPEDVAGLFPAGFVWTEDMGWIPDGWEVGCLSDLSEKITDGSHHSPASVDKVSGMPMASSKDITNHGVDFGTCRYISEDDFEILENNGCAPMNGDILISKDGSRCAETCCLYSSEKKVVLLSSVAIIRPKSEEYSSFIHALLSRKETVSDLRENYVSGSAIPRIVLRDFKRYPSVFPNQKILVEWQKVVDFFQQSGANRTNESSVLEKLRDVLLPKLLSGELRIPDAEKLIKDAGV